MSWINAEKMIEDTERMKKVAEAIDIDGIIKYINDYKLDDEAVKAIIVNLNTKQ